MCPATRVEYARTIRSDNNPESRSDDNFADIQLLPVSTRWSVGVENNTNFLPNEQRKHAELSAELGYRNLVIREVAKNIP